MQVLGVHVSILTLLPLFFKGSLPVEGQEFDSCKSNFVNFIYITH